MSEEIFGAEKSWQLEQASIDAEEDRFLNRAAIVAIGALSLIYSVVWGITELDVFGDVELSTEFKAIGSAIIGVLIGRFTAR